MNFFKNRNNALIARIYGGLGNQLFIYAAAKRLALKNNIQLKLDILSGFENDPYNRHYCLRHFNIHDEFADPYESFVSANGKKRKYYTRKINQLLPFGMKYYIEQRKPFESRLLDLKVSGKLYLQGYWQDERYFADIEKVIRKSFVITAPHDQKNKELAERIRNTNSVCLHARRLNYEFAVSREYYKKALGVISERVENPHFYCFADDPDWFATLDIEHPFTVITHNEEKNYEDLWLMQQCRHYIIANSSFSWWGAWLNPDPQKNVIAPKEWGYDTAIPTSWIAM